VRRRAHLQGVGPAHSQKSAIKPWLKGQWSIPPKQDASFVWRMEDVLEVYTRPYDERFPQVCLDEKSKQLVGEVREPLALYPGHPARYDYEYEREGTANLFIVSEPLAGWRHISVTERRTKLDWAHCIKELVDLPYPEAEKIVLVMENLNTHTPAALYEAFAPSEARRLSERLEIHYTPKHGSWLNMAEIELSVLARQCLEQRIPDQETLAEEVGAWEEERNAAESSIDWRFTSADARIKLKHLYPEIVEESSYDPNLS
jgi:transposase